ncbi:hypothetical protein SAMN02910358_01761 [Lachnospiraceae bacterium XBB1006]|nr:hypothetical protein SAMN02910358_01761 [Lachnospiraceae bacterium XBB1006]
MVNRAIDSKYRNTIVCIDSYEERILKGRVYNPYVNGEIGFVSLMDFIHVIEGMLEKMNFPQAYETKRTFQGKGDDDFVVQTCDPTVRGRIATFELKIFFRQNASWQGTLGWLDKKEEESFRSALEMMILMDSALQGEE